MDNTTVTIWVSKKTQFTFLSYLETIFKLDTIEFTINPNNMQLSLSQISNYIQINIDVHLYLKFMAVWQYNNGYTIK